MAMELLPEPSGDVATNKNNVGQKSGSEKSDANIEASDSSNELQPRPLLLQKSYWQQVLGNIDPLFYVTGCLSILILVSVFLMLLQRSEQHTDTYLKELKASNAELAERVADSKSNRGTPVSNTYALTGSASEKVDIQPETIPDSASTDLSSAESGMGEPETVDSVQPVDLSSPVGESADLELRLHEQAQQIELLVLENHELRLQAAFGAQGDSDISLNSVESTDGNENRSADSALSAELVEERAADMKRLVVNGYNAYAAGNYLHSRDWYNEAVQLDPFNRDANLGVAAAATALGHYKLAADRYRHLLSLDADDHEAFSSMLSLSSTSSMIETELLTHISKMSGNPAALYSIAGHYYGKTNRWSDAENMFTRSLASVRETAPPADYYFNLAVSFERTDQPGKAVEYYKLALNTPNGASFEREVVERQLRTLTQ